ncbi:hypothetical protein ACFYM0_33255 [Streptomyces sp. NPDC006487]|uniref:hypothetical protein n=1 Tax=Streptomyces sp. NPDC006487 TaxID=3364748 RepID=UPI0036B663B6
MDSSRLAVSASISSARAASYPYHSVQGTVGVWSSYPLRGARPVMIMPWVRAMRATVDTPQGPLALYTAHLASVRVQPVSGFGTERRNDGARKLAEAVRDEQLPRVMVVGDLNVKGVIPISAWTLPRTGSDHLPVAASVRL